MASCNAEASVRLSHSALWAVVTRRPLQITEVKPLPHVQWPDTEHMEEGKLPEVASLWEQASWRAAVDEAVG